MAFEHKENTGTVFVNEKANPENPDYNANAPTYKGKVNVAGKLYEVAMWQSDKNHNMMSIKISEPFKK